MMRTRDKLESYRVLAEALADSCGEGTAARAMALNAAGTLASEQGDYRQAAAFYDYDKKNEVYPFHIS